MSWLVVGGIGASVVGGVISGNAASDAADTQAASSDAAIQEQRLARNQVRGDLEPFRNLGASVTNPLLEFVLNGPESDFERTEGFEQIEKSAAAGGKLRSGGTLKDLTAFNNGLNSRNRSQQFGELFNLASLGSNAASGQGTATLSTAGNISDITIGRGDAQAAGQVSQGNAAGQTLSDLSRLLLARG